LRRSELRQRYCGNHKSVDGKRVWTDHEPGAKLIAVFDSNPKTRSGPVAGQNEKDEVRFGPAKLAVFESVYLFQEFLRTVSKHLLTQVWGFNNLPTHQA